MRMLNLGFLLRFWITRTKFEEEGTEMVTYPWWNAQLYDPMTNFKGSAMINCNCHKVKSQTDHCKYAKYLTLAMKWIMKDFNI